MQFNNLSYKLILFITILFCNTGKAQTILCKGSLGDPIKKIDFGNGIRQHGPPISETSFNFQSTGTPSDGWYTIAKSTVGMHPESWHQIGNHTTNDPDGYMMIVNASNAPSVFYEATISGLCANTTYEFAAWVINLMTHTGNKPDLTFTISTVQGVLLAAPYNTGKIPEGSATDWLHPGFLFTTPSDVNEIKISIRNNGEGGGGNDIAVDDITFSPCGPIITPSVNGVVTADKNLCIGDYKNFVLSAEVTPGVYTNPQYLWQVMGPNGLWQDMLEETSSQYTKKFEGAAVGSYKYRLLVAENGNINSPNCRVISPPFELNVQPLPTPTINGPTKPVCIGEPIQLTVSDASNYQWTGPNGFSSTSQSPVIPKATVEMAGTYYVTVTNEAGCVVNKEIEVFIVPRPVITIDAVTPICKGSSVTLNARADTDIGTTYSWLPDASLSATDIPSPVATPEKTTTYTVYVSNGSCRTSMDVTVHVLTPLQANAGPDLKIIKGNSIRLKGSVSGENPGDVLWTPSDFLDDPTKLNPIANPPFSMNYILNVTSSTDCAPASDQVFVKVYDKLVVPNSFSPNDDGINDIWNVIAIDTYANPTVKIMNRYGQLMFEGKGDKTAWDGKRGNEDVPVGVYYYMINLETGLKPLTGSLTLIR
ncbi:gliding motility-associated C-terminal domain-containing protein [Pedobacter nyackensis]|uniref:T9SS type B sorting domain-containing protein n=1 Tax=Pedobacter nyackensis TaxID=475255 RepID=UPI002931D46A|nr:gliding motility-associated C-terminal domain-containing protein [Pedobacter nyackensis]